jgi:hypothetical protein
MKKLDLVAAITLGTIGFIAPAAAEAHFILSTPVSWAVLDGSGGPQKSAPCGQADPGQPPVLTNMVGDFHPGDTVTITVTETVFHPGHYRVSLAPTQAALPADPAVTAGSTACGSTVVQNPAVFPVLADGMLDHTAPFNGPQSFTVKLPDTMTCAKCTLQIVEFMSNHGLNNPGGCFYHHCADISIQATATVDAGSTTGAGGSSGAAGTTKPNDSSGCAYATGLRGSAADLAAGAGALALLALGARRRSRRRV